MTEPHQTADLPDFQAPDRLMSSVMSMAQEAVDRVEVLRAALRELETANDALCALRTPDIYNAMLAVPGTQEALERLDDARRRARKLSA